MSARKNIRANVIMIRSNTLTVHINHFRDISSESHTKRQRRLFDDSTGVGCWSTMLYIGLVNRPSVPDELTLADLVIVRPMLHLRSEIISA